MGLTVWMPSRFKPCLNKVTDLSASTYLLDTNVLLSAVIAPEWLSPDVRDKLSSPNNIVYFSAASIWEIAIKRSLHKVDFDFSPEDIHGLALETGFIELTVQAEHCYSLADMPWLHRDPFDRLLIAQAQSLPAYLLTSDKVLDQYSDLVMHTVLKKS